MKQIKENIIQEQSKEKIIFWLLAFALASVLSSYIYLVNQTVFDIVERNRTEGRIGELSTAVGEMEFEYIALKDRITLDFAYEQGYKEVSKASFVSKKTVGAALTLANEL